MACLTYVSPAITDARDNANEIVDPYFQTNPNLKSSPSIGLFLMYQAMPLLRICGNIGMSCFNS